MSLQLPFQLVEEMPDVQANFEAIANPQLKWAVPTLLNSWANLGGAFETAAYLKDPLGFVHLQGVVMSGASGTVAFVLPAGFRPGATTDHGVAAYPVSGACQISTNGNVTLFYSSGSPDIGLSGITFLAAN